MEATALWAPGRPSRERGSPGGQVASQLPLGAHHQVLAEAARLLLHPPDVLGDVGEPLQQAGRDGRHGLRVYGSALTRVPILPRQCPSFWKP